MRLPSPAIISPLPIHGGRRLRAVEEEDRLVILARLVGLRGAPAARPPSHDSIVDRRRGEQLLTFR